MGLGFEVLALRFEVLRSKVRSPVPDRGFGQEGRREGPAEGGRVQRKRGRGGKRPRKAGSKHSDRGSTHFRFYELVLGLSDPGRLGPRWRQGEGHEIFLTETKVFHLAGLGL